MNKNQRGFAHVTLALILLAVIMAIGFVIYRISNSDSNKSSGDVGSIEQAQKSETKIKHLGINIDKFDPVTGMAGDLKFTKFQFPEGTYNTIFVEYGRREPNNSAEGNSERYNPQPTFLAPLGTKIHSIVDGTVVSVPKLYSNDYSVHVKGNNSDVIFETEHVTNVKVKVGDKVRAGDVIAEISDYNGDTLDGLGLFEIGVLIPGNPPKHVCTFDYLDDSIKEEMLSKITTLQRDWEEYRGDNSVYDEAGQVIPGCVNRNPIEG